MVTLWLGECVHERLVLLYEVDGTKYLEIESFEQRIRPGQKSKFPQPAEIRRGSREKSAQAESEAYSETEAKAGLAENLMPSPTIKTEFGREVPNPAWRKAQDALRANRDAIARARDPVAYEKAILRRVVQQ